ncbi:hypothetical protein EVAR_13020_1 [Eumeta japonica]|uniref:Uncharacterized protein n=1 Tax=Eumeta variegata TaxID=151549 RepID=A0A4C1TX04_EUMVA|nr:hypothetical protein EVAR_13020_1 [Eumeta japonica]
MKSISVISLAAIALLLQVSNVKCYVGYGANVPMIIEKDDTDLQVAMMMLMAMNNPRTPPYACGNGCGGNCGCGKSCNCGNVPIPLPIPIPMNSPTFARPPYCAPLPPTPGPVLSDDTQNKRLLSLILSLLGNVQIEVKK